MQATFNLIAAQLYASFPQEWRTIRNTGRNISVVPEHFMRVPTGFYGPVTGFMVLLMAVVSLVLLTACANVANLLLARGMSRAREIGIRVALGSSRARLIRHILTENILLSLVAGAFGVFVAHGVMRALESITPPIPAAIAVLTSTALLACYIPARRALRIDPARALRLE